MGTTPVVVSCANTSRNCSIDNRDSINLPASNAAFRSLNWLMVRRYSWHRSSRLRKLVSISNSTRSFLTTFFLWSCSTYSSLILVIVVWIKDVMSLMRFLFSSILSYVWFNIEIISCTQCLTRPWFTRVRWTILRSSLTDVSVAVPNNVWLISPIIFITPCRFCDKLRVHVLSTSSSKPFDFCILRIQPSVILRFTCPRRRVRWAWCAKLWISLCYGGGNLGGAIVTTNVYSAAIDLTVCWPVTSNPSCKGFMATGITSTLYCWYIKMIDKSRMPIPLLLSVVSFVLRAKDENPVKAIFVSSALEFCLLQVITAPLLVLHIVDGCP